MDETCDVLPYGILDGKLKAKHWGLLAKSGAIPEALVRERAAAVLGSMFAGGVAGLWAAFTIARIVLG